MDYSKYGWATFPCHGKVPATPRGLKDADKTGEIFTKYPAENIAIATGNISGIFVLDIDVKNGAKGNESLAELIAKNGALPETISAETWSGGKHYFFRMPKEHIGNRTNIVPGIDVRGNGGYVIAPPSIIGGKSYKWINGPDAYEPDPAPEWLLDMLRENRDATPPALGAISEGGRNQELTSRAGKMRAAGLDSHDIYSALLKINTERCSPPLPEKEVRMIAESVSRYEIRNVDAPLTDIWNSERFADKYGDSIKWCDKLEGWFAWNGSAWRNTESTSILKMAKELIKDLMRQSEASGDKKLKAHIVRSQSMGKLSSMIELAKSEVAVDLKEFDHNDNLLNCANGTLNLNTGEMQPPQKEQMITKSIPLNYDKDAKCPLWLKFLNETFSGDAEMIDYVQRTLGYALSGYTNEQKFFILYGSGRNGKSTLLKHIMAILGDDYSAGTPAETMLESDGNTLHAIAALKGKRMVVLNEVDEGKTLSSAIVKTLTGGEPVVARHLYHAQFSYIPTYKFFMTTNHKPRIRDTSLGTWRRLVLIPFDHVIPLEKVDHSLDVKLETEHAGILAWAVEGYKKWKSDGLPVLKRLQKEAVCYQGQSDVIGQFLDDVVDLEANPAEASTSVVDFIKEFRLWSVDNGVKHIPSRSAIMDYIDRKGYGRPIRKTDTVFRGLLAWHGFAIKRSEHAWGKN